MMKARWIFFSLVLVLSASLLPAQAVRSEPAAPTAPAVTILYFPGFITHDATFNAYNALTSGTPFAVYVRVTGMTAGQVCSGPKIRMYSQQTTGLQTSFRTWAKNTGEWLNDAGAMASFGDVTAGAGGTWAGWAYGALPTDIADAWLEARIQCGSTLYTSTPRVHAGILQMTAGTGTGGWLAETSGYNRAGKIVVLRNPANAVLGLYPSEPNTIQDNYPQNPGYYRIAVPACTGCGYKVEIWDPQAPGTAVGTVNVMGQSGCPDAISAGQETTMDTCGVPTALRLVTLSTRGTGERSSAFLLAVLLAFVSLSSLWLKKSLPASA